MAPYLAAGFEQRGGEAEVLRGQGAQRAAYRVAAGREGGWLALIGEQPERSCRALRPVQHSGRRGRRYRRRRNAGGFGRRVTRACVVNQRVSRQRDRLGVGKWPLDLLGSGFVLGAIVAVLALGFFGQLAACAVIDRTVNPDARRWWQSEDEYLRTIVDSCTQTAHPRVCIRHSVDEAFDRGYLTGN